MTDQGTDERGHRHTAESLVEQLELEPHPEGGFFRETWRSERELELDDYEGTRNAGTSILFLLRADQSSAWHRVKSDELWLWQAGDPLELSLMPELSAEPERIVLGGDEFQAVVSGGWWQAARPVSGEHGYSLCGCVVVPGFDFRDFEMVESSG